MTMIEKISNIMLENDMVSSDIIINEDMNLISDLGFDSIKLMGLLFEIEQEFDISIINDTSNYKFFTVESVSDIVSLLER